MILIVKHTKNQWEFRESFHVTKEKAKEIRQRAG
ncbi:hypothetical protein K9D10_001724 [Enterococcus faecalis]|nr:hypothetical protein [Enterococcus faecalis]